MSFLAFAYADFVLSVSIYVVISAPLLGVLFKMYDSYSPISNTVEIARITTNPVLPQQYGSDGFVYAIQNPVAIRAWAEEAAEKIREMAGTFSALSDSKVTYIGRSWGGRLGDYTLKDLIEQLEMRYPNLSATKIADLNIINHEQQGEIVEKTSYRAEMGSAFSWNDTGLLMTAAFTTQLVLMQWTVASGLTAVTPVDLPYVYKSLMIGLHGRDEINLVPSMLERSYPEQFRDQIPVYPFIVSTFLTSIAMHLSIFSVWLVRLQRLMLQILVPRWQLLEREGSIFTTAALMLCVYGTLAYFVLYGVGWL